MDALAAAALSHGDQIKQEEDGDRPRARQRQTRAAAARVQPAPSPTVEPTAPLAPTGQGTKRKRSAPPESCPFCNHFYTVRDGLSSRVDSDSNRLHLRRCQCRRKAPPCRNCPDCKRRIDVMELASNVSAALELCQRKYSCAICACKCPGVGKWVEGDEESRSAYAERTLKRQEDLAEMGYGQDGQPTSTPGGDEDAHGPAATSAATAPAGQEAPQPKRQTSSKAGASLRRLPADIRLELEQQQQQQQQHSKGKGKGMVAGGEQLQGQRSHETACTADHDAHSAPPASQQQRNQQQQRTHRHAHRHICDHPHEDCTSECCSAPAVPTAAGEVVAGLPAGTGLLCGDPQTSVALFAAALDAAQLAQQRQAAESSGLPLPVGLGIASDLLRSWELMRGAEWAAVAQPLPLAQAPQQQEEQEPVHTIPPPELPAAVTELVQEVFNHAAGEAAASAVAAFLQQQRVTSLGDLEYLELTWMERDPELARFRLPPLLFNKLLRLGRVRWAASQTALNPAEGPGNRAVEMAGGGSAVTAGQVA